MCGMIVASFPRMTKMSHFNQLDYLLREQYRDASNLNARIALHERFSLNPEPWWAWVWRMTHLPASARILEVGTGPADFWRTNLDRIPDGWRITLSDFSPGMIRQARANLGAAAARFHFARINVVALPFPAGAFDGVFANFMLYHAPDLDRAIRELYRVLRPGGKLYAATVGVRHMKQLKDLLRRLDPKAILVRVEDLFGLESGVDALHHHFPIVNRYLYDDALHVTKTEPLVAYALSGQRSPELERDPEPLRQAIRRTIEREGAFVIEKHSGLFEAIKAAASAE